MMQEVHGNFNTGLPQQNQHSTGRRLFSLKRGLKFKEKRLVKCCIWIIALYSAENWTHRKEDQKYLESFEMWCWKRMEKISWIDRVRHEAVLL